VSFDLASMAKQKGIRRSSIELRAMTPPQTLAQELAAVYRPVLDAWDAGRPRIMEVYAHTVSTLTGDSPADIEAELNGISGGIDRLILTLTAALRDWTVRVERWHRDRWSASVLSASSIDLDTLLTASEVSDTVDSALRWNVSLIKDVSAQARQRIASRVFAAVQNRTPAADLARELRDVVDMGRTRAKLIAADQTQKLTARLDQARQEQAGISEYTWRHSYKAHPRPVHVARNGKVFSWDNPPADGPPGTLPYCGCRAQARINLE
jgi:SPP1 gp7 family putative phage head morphogenesis protein